MPKIDSTSGEDGGCDIEDHGVPAGPPTHPSQHDERRPRGAWEPDSIFDDENSLNLSSPIGGAPDDNVENCGDVH